MSEAKRYLTVIVLSIGVAVLVSASVAVALARETEPPSQVGAAGPLGSAFTYQGQLKAGGNPVNDTCDMAFRLYDEASDGSQVGAAISTTVPITDGLFTLQLDFGASAFDGDARWLGIKVKCPGDVDYGELGRQALTATPYAIYAASAGQSISSTWTGLTGVPSGFADNTDDVDDYVSWDEVASIVSTDTHQLAEGDHTHDPMAVPDLNVDANGDIKITDDPFSPDTDVYRGTVRKILLKDLPNLLHALGDSGITLAHVNANVKIIMVVSVETYLEPQRAVFVAYRWARITGNPAGNDESDIYWPVKVVEDTYEATEAISDTYKLFQVTTFLH